MKLLPLLSCLLAAGASALEDRNAAFVKEALELMGISESSFVNNVSAVHTTLTTVAGAAPTTHNFQAAAADPAYWLKDIAKQGIAAFNDNPSGYKVWRNVMDYGARGDGVTDDTAAINRAISDGNRCGPFVCQSSTVTPAIVYFPAGTYIIGNPIIMYYYTQIIGNANSRPVLKANPNLSALALIDASPYGNNGQPGWTSTNTFMRQIRNIVIDLTPITAAKAAQGIHWPASQATNIQNVKILMNQASNSQQTGIFIENGSGGHMVDLEISGGLYGMNIGNQQFTMRGIRISNAVIGISQIWNWGWLYQGLTITNCQTAFSMINGGSSQQTVGSVVIIDSDITNCPTFVDMAWTPSSSPRGAGQLIVENINMNNVGVAVKYSGATVLNGGTGKIAAWGQGHRYTPDGPQTFQGSFTPARRPGGLLNGDKYWAISKPQYEGLPVSSFYSARSLGARGDGRTDDTTAVQNAINKAVADNKVLYFDHGTYIITNTIRVPPGARMVGETFSVLQATGNTWSNVNNPVPVIQIGRPGESGQVQWSDMIVATQGPTPGAKIIEYNLNSARGSGLWDIHTRIGGAKGTSLQVAQCPTYSNKPQCMAAHTNVHITKSASGVYFENNWFWTADHDLDDPSSTQISIFTGRGLLVEGTNVWLWGTGVEHHALYQFQFSTATNVFAGFIQTETPYWQPSPDVKSQPYPLDTTNYHDPDYNSLCPAGICDALALRIVDSNSIHVYGAGLYSFFKNYDNSCSKDTNAVRDCQNRIFSVEGNSNDIIVYALSQVGALQMVTIDRADKAGWTDNLSVYSNTIGLFSYRV